MAEAPEGWTGLAPVSDLDLPIYRRCRWQPAKTPGQLRRALRCVQVTNRAGWKGFCPLPCRAQEMLGGSSASPEIQDFALKTTGPRAFICAGVSV